MFRGQLKLIPVKFNRGVLTACRKSNLALPNRAAVSIVVITVQRCKKRGKQ